MEEEGAFRTWSEWEEREWSPAGNEREEGWMGEGQALVKGWGSAGPGTEGLCAC